MTKAKLIQNIQTAFKDVELEDGIGLWEAQGHDDRLSPQECAKLHTKDEIKDWSKISVKDLYLCNSSLSFFNAKGMRFHLPQFLLLDLGVYQDEEDKLQEAENIGYAPDMEFLLIGILKYLHDDSQHGKGMLNYHKNRFSALNVEQIKCVIAFLEYKISEVNCDQDEYCNTCGKVHTGMSYRQKSRRTDKLEEAIWYWKTTIKDIILTNEKLFETISRILQKNQIDIFEYDSKDELWKTAYLLCVEKSKQFSKELIHFAISIKLVAIQEEIKTKFTQKDCLNIFKNFFQHFPDFKEQVVEPNYFFKHYNEIMDGIETSKGKVFTKNGEIISEKLVIQKEEIIKCFCDVDDWNLRAFFIETQTHYLYFYWSTGA